MMMTMTLGVEDLQIIINDMKEEKPKKRCTLKKVPDITKYELQMDGAKPIAHPVKNTYAEKKTGEIVKIDWRDGAFRYL